MSHEPRNFSFRGLTKLVRLPNLLIIVLTQYFTAYFLADALKEPWSWELFILSAATVMLAAAGYIINDYYDVKIDFINKPERVVVGKVLKRRVVMAWHTVLNFTAVGLGFYLSWKLGLIFFVTAFLLWLYSNQLKRLPVIGNVVVAFLTGMSVLIIAVYFQKKELLVVTYSLFAFAITWIREVIKDMEDMKGDQTFGCKTLPIVWGLRKTKRFVYGLILLFAALFFLLTQSLDLNIVFIFFGGMTLMIGFLIYRLNRADTIREFHFLSTYCKIIMLTGVVSMFFF